MRVVFFEGCFLHWSEQIFILHLETDDLLQFLVLSQALDINLNEERGEKGKSYFTRHIVITPVGIAVTPFVIWCPSPGQSCLTFEPPQPLKHPMV